MMLAASLSGVVSYTLIEVAVAVRMEISRQQQRIQQFETLRFVSYTLSQKNQQLINFSDHTLTIKQFVRYHQQSQWLNMRYFIARNSRGSLALYRQPDESGAKQQLAENIVSLKIAKTSKTKELIVWLLVRSSDAIFSGSSCYFFLNKRYCRHDGYRYLAWPVYVA
jgi:type II secretory pathway component PulJ